MISMPALQVRAKSWKESALSKHSLISLCTCVSFALPVVDKIEFEISPHTAASLQLSIVIWNDWHSSFLLLFAIFLVYLKEIHASLHRTQTRGFLTAVRVGKPSFLSQPSVRCLSLPYNDQKQYSLWTFPTDLSFIPPSPMACDGVLVSG